MKIWNILIAFWNLLTEVCGRLIFSLLVITTPTRAEHQQGQRNQDVYIAFWDLLTEVFGELIHFIQPIGDNTNGGRDTW